MNDFHRVREVAKSRKASCCDYCLEEIGIREPKVVESGKWDGALWSMTYHPECHSIAEEILREANEDNGGFDDGVDPDDAFNEAEFGRLRGIVVDRKGRPWRLRADGTAADLVDVPLEVGDRLPKLLDQLLACIPDRSVEGRTLNEIRWAAGQIAWLLGFQHLDQVIEASTRIHFHRVLDRSK